MDSHYVSWVWAIKRHFYFASPEAINFSTIRILKKR
jgi:hypothetical protein